MQGATIKKVFSNVSFHLRTRLLEIVVMGCDVIHQILLRQVILSTMNKNQLDAH
jgi:hypothetical protein